MVPEVFVSSVNVLAGERGLFGGLRQWSLLNAAQVGMTSHVVGPCVLEMIPRDGSP